jgi:hypothetical protein
MALLSEVFSERIISKSMVTNITNLTTRDLLGGAMKGDVYKDNPDSLLELEEAIIKCNDLVVATAVRTSDLT